MQKVGRIHCAQPNYGTGHPNSHRAFWNGMLLPDSPYRGRVNRVDGGRSLLANAFNLFWVQALNLQVAYSPPSWTYCWQADAEQGEGWYIQNQRLGIQHGPYPKESELEPERDRLAEEGNVTHFAMLHHDVCPQDGWLDVLMQEILKHDADVVSVAVPIKDNLGLTSTAIDDPAKVWEVERRVTMTELHRLPETFSAADCGYPGRKLLVNTGCFVCRFDKSWRFPPFRFHIDDVVSYDSDRCVFKAEVRPEDWNFSRHVQQEGGKVLATRKVLLTHSGDVAYTNQEPWGDFKVDMAFAHKFGGKGILEPEERKVDGGMLRQHGISLRKRTTAEAELIEEVSEVLS